MAKPELPRITASSIRQDQARRRAEVSYTGTAQPGDEVVVRVAGGKSFSGTVDAAGCWQVDCPGLGDGSHQFSIHARVPGTRQRSESVDFSVTISGAEADEGRLVAALEKAQSAVELASDVGAASPESPSGDPLAQAQPQVASASRGSVPDQSFAQNLPTTMPVFEKGNAPLPTRR